MKTTIHTIFVTLLTGVTLLSSCDDYLTTLPSNSLVSEGAITTEEDTRTAVNGLYQGLISVDGSYYYGTDFITRPEVGGEDIQTRMVGDRTENFYRFTDRQNNARYNPQIQISAESETKRSIFREKDKTKRSKKESAQHSKSRNKSFVMTSVSAL